MAAAMTVFEPRSAWTSSRATAGNLVRPIGYGFHWPGSPQKWTGLSRSAVASRLEGIRRYHTKPKSEGGPGYADVAYQVAVDQAGRVWDLRGIGRQSGANGNRTLNQTWGAFLLLLGPGEEPTPQMHEAVRALRRRWLDVFPGADRETWHGAIRPGGTECPGPAARRHVQAGTWRKPPAITKPDPPEDEMSAQAEKDIAALRYLLPRMSARQDEIAVLSRSTNEGVREVARVVLAAAILQPDAAAQLRAAVARLDNAAANDTTTEDIARLEEMLARVATQAGGA